MGISILAWLSSLDPYWVSWWYPGQYGNDHVLICIYSASVFTILVLCRQCGVFCFSFYSVYCIMIFSILPDNVWPVFGLCITGFLYCYLLLSGWMNIFFSRLTFLHLYFILPFITICRSPENFLSFNTLAVYQCWITEL